MKIPIVCLVLIVSTAAHAQTTKPTLKDAAADRLLVGVAVTSAQLKNPKSSAMILEQFDYLTPEFELFPQFVHPEPEKFTYARADAVVDFAVQHDLKVTGHMLCWNQFSPKWMYTAADGTPLPRQQALDNLKGHIDAVMRHYRGKIESWNVVNEAVSDKADQYLRDTPAARAIGDDYVAKAFEFAHAADPKALLYYNDYNVEDPVKLPKVLKLLRSLPTVDAVGIQGHWLLKYPPTKTIDDALTALEQAHLKVFITEMDIDVLPRAAGADLNAVQKQGEDPYKAGLPNEKSDELAKRYADIFGVLLKHPNVTRVTFWGLDDRQSWLNDFPVKGRTNYPLLFDRSGQPKPAFDAVLEALKRK